MTNYYWCFGMNQVVIIDRISEFSLNFITDFYINI